MILSEDAQCTTKRHAALNGKTGCYHAISNFSFISGVFAQGSSDGSAISLLKHGRGSRVGVSPPLPEQGGAGLPVIAAKAWQTSGVRPEGAGPVS